MTEVRLLRDEMSKGKARNLAALAIRLGRSEQALISQGNRQKARPLLLETRQRPGFGCGRCGATAMWDELPSDDPIALIETIAQWKRTHTSCEARR